MALLGDVPLEIRTQDIAYRRWGDFSWLVRVYQPEGNGPFPALIDVHGGQWVMGDRMQNEHVSRWLAARGIVVFAVDFRLGFENPYPAQVVDVNYATRWIKLHASEFNAQPQQVGGLGSSSGGNTLLLSCMRWGDARFGCIPLRGGEHLNASVSYAICLWPVLDPYDRYLFAERTGRDDIVHNSQTYFQASSTMRDASVPGLLRRELDLDLPPILLIQGKADKNLPWQTSERFAAEYRGAGGSCELTLFEGAAHGFMRDPSPDTDRAFGLISQFIAQHAPIASGV
jgi:acetyl esterase/lipase